MRIERPRSTALFALLGVWALVYLASFVALAVVAPDGSGFTATWQRFVPFVWLQLVASFLSLLTTAVTYRRWSDLSRPMALLGLLPILLAVAAIAVWAFLAYLAS